jgi:hypothetical protein
VNFIEHFVFVLEFTSIVDTGAFIRATEFAQFDKRERESPKLSRRASLSKGEGNGTCVIRGNRESRSRH